MGKTLGGIGGFFTGDGNAGLLGPGGVLGNNPLTKKLGLSGEQGEFFTPTTANQGLDQLNAENQALTSTKYNDGLRDMSNGKTSLADGMKNLTGVQREGAMTDGIVGSRLAAQEVQNSPLTSGLFGVGGLNDRLSAEEKALSSRGYSLQPQDHEAYGQASGNISRQFGQQEQDLSKSLARRGLASAGSGAAGAGFSGLAGSKNEMLAKAQTDIAQKRMADTNQRVQQTRNMMGQLGMQGAALQDDQYSRQLSGAKNRQQNVTNAAQLQTGANNSNNSAGLASMEDKRGAKGKTLMEGFGQGLFSSAQQTGAAPGTFVSGMAGAAGQAGGSMMASDEDNKENIRDGSDDVQGFLDSLTASKYEYKPEAKGLFGAGEEEYVSPMAQDLEQTDMGAAMVEDTPGGKVVDYGKGFGALAAAQAQINERLKKLEGQR